LLSTYICDYTNFIKLSFINAKTDRNFIVFVKQTGDETQSLEFALGISADCSLILISRFLTLIARTTDFKSNRFIPHGESQSGHLDDLVRWHVDNSPFSLAFLGSHCCTASYLRAFPCLHQPLSFITS